MPSAIFYLRSRHPLLYEEGISSSFTDFIRLVNMLERFAALTNPFQPSCRPVCDVLGHRTFIECPYRLLDYKVGVLCSKFAGGIRWIVGSPVLFSSGQVREL